MDRRLPTAAMNTFLRSRTHTRRAVTVSTCLGLMVALSACGAGGGGDGPGSKQLDLVIGNALPLSGPSKELGSAGKKASNLAIAQINDAIGEVDAEHTVRAVEQDQGEDGASAIQAARKLVDNGASCLTGPWSTDAVEQVAQDIAVPSKVLEIAPVPSNEDVAELSDHDLVDSTALPESLEGSALSTVIERDLGGVQGRTVNGAASSDNCGDTLSEDFIEDWQGKDGIVGGHVVLNTAASSIYPAQA